MENDLTGDGRTTRHDFGGNGGRAPSQPGGPAARAGQDGVGCDTSRRPQSANRLLGALPPEEFERLLPYLQPVTLAALDRADELKESHYVYFPEGAVVSHIVAFEDGSTVEAAMTGCEGAVGCDAAFGATAPTHQTRVTLPGGALQMRADYFRQEFAENETLSALVFEHASRRVAQVAQRGACAIRHRIESRLATWLLMMHDRAGLDELPFTQEFIARRIGARRAGVTEAACKFQDFGLIRYRRGCVRVTGRAALEAAACECYEVLRDI